MLSIFRPPIEQTLFSAYQHKLIPIDDTEDENLLEHLPACNAFIRKALSDRPAGKANGILVHCVMGKSRSAAVTMAFLMSEHNMTCAESLAHIRQARPFCEPNEGFMEQLALYHAMGCPEDIDAAPAYQRWLYRREVDSSRACGQAPEANKIRFEDEHADVSKHDENNSAAQSSLLEFRCKKCRRALATSAYLTPHTPAAGKDPKTCAHHFVDPLSWMRPELEKGEIEGRLNCPKCSTNVGKYAWQGMRCSCGQWIVPAVTLAKGRVDEHRASAASSDLGIRRPPTSTQQSTANDKGHL